MSKSKSSTKKFVTFNSKNTVSFFKKFMWQFILVSAAIICAVVGIFTVTVKAEIPIPNVEVNFEEQLFDYAEEYSEKPDFYLEPIYALEYVAMKNSNEFYDAFSYRVKIQNYEYEQLFESGLFVGNASTYDGIYDETEFDEFSEHQIKMIDAARNHVVKYIDDSNVLRDKEILIEAIKSVPFHLYTGTTNEELSEVIDAPAVHVGSSIFCNKEYDEFFSVYMLTHELFHHLRYLTNGANFSELTYVGTMYDEGITDFLTLSTGLESPIIKGYACGYEYLHNVIGEYLNIFGEKALEGFFYGTEEFFDSFYTNFQAEHHAFVCALDYYGQEYSPQLVCRAILKYWHENAA